MTATPAPVTLDCRVFRSAQVMVQDVGGEAVLLDLASEQYFGLDRVGSRVWALLGETDHLGTVLARLCEQFDADPARIQQDLLALTHDLAEAGLVSVA
jgi:ornithine carbamoyltransferase